ncbi:GNAT family N-acetyltransferase [uncultured Formosa sp.]|uniref:GNAT family N-acetyltransferase n=1 Tax=uncultured Formosa sp. TaxID=255435 RepID=UPI002626FF98|nr:GNAT family N-acetyltransferase [uncultured Formosa sp.]
MTYTLKPTDLDFRAAAASDLNLTYAIKTKSIKPYVASIWGWDDDFQYHTECFNPLNTQIICYKKEAIGFFNIIETETFFIIENLLISENFQSLGIGEFVLDTILLQTIKEKKSVRLQVFKINTKAQQFYRRFGFKSISTSEHHILMEK